MPKRDRHRVDRAIGNRDARRVAAHQRDATFEPLALRAFSARHEHPPAKSTPMTRAAAGRASAAAIARSPVPVHKSSTRSVRQPQRLESRGGANAIDAGAEQVVEEIVAAGDRVEHAGDAFGRFEMSGDFQHRRPSAHERHESTKDTKDRLFFVNFVSFRFVSFVVPSAVNHPDGTGPRWIEIVLEAERRQNFPGDEVRKIVERLRRW